MQEAWVPLLVGELRSHMPHSAAKNEREREREMGQIQVRFRRWNQEGWPRGGLGGDEKISGFICHFNGDITDLDEEKGRGRFLFVCFWRRYRECRVIFIMFGVRC